jgi:hypothetical protein
MGAVVGGACCRADASGRESEVALRVPARTRDCCGGGGGVCDERVAAKHALVSRARR